MHLSQNVRELQPSATLTISNLARELRARGRDIVDLSAGEPDLPTPRFVRNAGIEAIEQGHTRYTAVAGVPALREAIALSLSRRSRARIDPAGIVVSTGAKQALFNACFSLFGPGDRVLLPAPYWTSYPALIGLSRAEPVIVPGDEARSFRVSTNDLDAAYTPAVRGLILNSPANPTGAVYSQDEIRAIVAWAAEHDVWVLSDEIYGPLCYTGPRAPGVLDLEPGLLSRVVLIDGASKAFAMTGWRIGFSYCAPELAARFAALQSHVTSNPASPSQYAALAAFSADGRRADAIDEITDAFRRRRELVIRLLDENLPDIPYVRPDGAFYAFLRIDGFFDERAASSTALCERLIEEAGVVLIPGAAFGEDRYARLSFAVSDETLREGVSRLARALAGAGSPSGAASA